MAQEKKVTAAELMESLERDPSFVARREAKKRHLEEMRKSWRTAEQPIVADLRRQGLDLESVWELVNSQNDYSQVLPILLDHLQRPYPDRIREGIARALAVPESRFAWDVLARLYREEGPSDAKDGLAVAISAAASDDVLDDMIELTRDRRHGGSRLLLLSALERSAEPRAAAALKELGADPELEKEIPVILRRMARRKGKKGERS